MRATEQSGKEVSPVVSRIILLFVLMVVVVALVASPALATHGFWKVLPTEEPCRYGGKAEYKSPAVERYEQNTGGPKEQCVIIKPSSHK